LSSFSDLEKILSLRKDIDLSFLRKAYYFSEKAHHGQKRKSGEDYIIHPLTVALILAEQGADEKTLIAALLHDTVEDTSVTRSDIKKFFGRTVSDLVETVTKVSSVEYSGSKVDRKKETLRKMLTGGTFDVRALIIKLADRLHNMQTLSAQSPQKQQQISRETQEIFLPLAEQLGLRKIKRGLQELCFSILFPDVAAYRKNFFSRKMQDVSLRKTKETLLSFSSVLGIESVLRNPFSLLQKKDFCLDACCAEDIFFFQIILRNEDDCYLFLRNIHTHWKTIPGSEQDFLSRPKENGYRAYQIKILLESGEVFSFSLVTEEIAMFNEGGGIFSEPLRKPSSFLAHLFDIDISTQEKPDLFFEATKTDLLEEQICIYVDDREVTLPKNITLLDAFFFFDKRKAIHLIDVMHNGKKALFSKIITEGSILLGSYSKVAIADFSWFYQLKSATARFALQKFLRKKDQKEKVCLGESILQKEFDLYEKGDVESFCNSYEERIISLFHVKTKDEFYGLIADGSLVTTEAMSLLFPQQKIGWKQKVYDFFKNIFLGEDRGIRIHIDGVTEKNTIQNIEILRKEYGISVSKTVIQENKKNHTFSCFLDIVKNKKKDLHYFLGSLECLDGIIAIRPLLSKKKQTIFLSWLLLGFFFLGIMPFFLQGIESHFGEEEIFRKIMPYFFLLPVLTVNFLLSAFLRNYVAQIRNTKWPLVIGLIFNLFGFLFFTLLLLHHNSLDTLLIPLFLFIFSSLVFVIRYLPHNLRVKKVQNYYSTKAMIHIPTDTKQRIYGYLFRFSAIFFFGVTPILIKYFLVDINGVAIVSISFWVAFLALFPLIVYKIFKGSWGAKENYSKFFWITVLADGVILIFYFFSMHLTAASNSILFLNFAPVIALVFALFFWKSSLPYFRDKNTTKKIILAFLFGTAGTSLLVFGRGGGGSEYKILGDFFAFLGMIFDVVATIALIFYAKSKHAFSGIDYIIRKVVIISFLLSPVALYTLTHHSFSSQEILILFLLGIFNIIFAYWFSYEAYKRLDGFINYLLFNLASVVTIYIEVFYFNLPLTYSFAIGATLIIFSSVVAEYINAKSEKSF